MSGISCADAFENIFFVSDSIVERIGSIFFDEIYNG